MFLYMLSNEWIHIYSSYTGNQKQTEHLAQAKGKAIVVRGKTVTLFTIKLITLVTNLIQFNSCKIQGCYPNGLLSDDDDGIMLSQKRKITGKHFFLII